MPTQSFTLTAGTWTPIGTSPCVVTTLSVQPALIYEGTSAPDLSAPYDVLRAEDPDGYPSDTTGNSIWARALNDTAKVVVRPKGAAGGGGGGGASTVSGSQEQDVTESRTLAAGTLGAQQTYTLNGQSTFAFNFTGLAESGATVTFYKSTNWNGTTGTFQITNEVNTGTGAASSTRSTNGQSAIGIEGDKAVRVEVTTAGSGTITLATNISVRSRYAALRSPVNQGAAGTTPWPTIDGTDGPGANPGTGTRGWLSGIYAKLTADPATGAKQDAANTTATTNATNTGNVATATGSKSDPATASGADTSIIGALRAIRDKILGTLAVSATQLPATLGQKIGANSLPVVLPSDQTVPVSGTFWQATQPVSGTFWQATQPVSGTFWQATQPVSGTFWQAVQPIAGNVASAATDSGNPVKVGGVYNTTPPTLTNGQRGDLQLGQFGQMFASIYDSGTAAPARVITGASDAGGATTYGLLTSSRTLLYNPGTTQFERAYTAAGAAGTTGTGITATAITPTSGAVGITPVTTTTSSLSAKTSAGNLYGFGGTFGATAGYIAILNLAAPPSAGAAISPVECVPVAANASYRTRQDIPDRYGTGIQIVATSSPTQYTAVTPVVLQALVQ